MNSVNCQKDLYLLKQYMVKANEDIKDLKKEIEELKDKIELLKQNMYIIKRTSINYEKDY